jgi:hypothetical protein
MKKRTVFGLPLTPIRHLAEIAGGSFCVSYATRQTLGKQLDQAIAAVGDDEILLVDNGAFSAWRSGVPMDVDGFARWAADIMARCPQAVAVVPDVIDGDAADNDDMLVDFRGAVLELGLELDADRTMAVWHMHEPLERLTGLVEGGFQYVAIGSSGEYAQPGTPAWHARIGQAFAALDNLVSDSNGAYRRPWLHMMRAQAEGHRYDFDSTDSCNLAVNHCRYRETGPGHVGRLAARIAGKIDASCDGAERQTIEPPADAVAAEAAFREKLATVYGRRPQPAAQPAAAPATTQLHLFELEPPAPPAKWIGHRGPWGRNLTWTRDDMPDLVVRHCGHPTANYPYHVTTRDNQDAAGLGTFHNLATCQAAAAAWFLRGQPANQQPTPGQPAAQY